MLETARFKLFSAHILTPDCGQINRHRDDFANRSGSDILRADELPRPTMLV
jgi:hypothetical protein